MGEAEEARSRKEEPESRSFVPGPRVTLKFAHGRKKRSGPAGVGHGRWLRGTIPSFSRRPVPAFVMASRDGAAF